jgi:hypothetical protein
LAANEEDLSKKGSNQPQLYQVREKQLNQLERKDKTPRVLMTLALFHRRKTMLLWSYSSRLNPTSIKELAKTFECTEKALLNDWAKREIWEPFIWEQQKATVDAKEILKFLQLAREEALYLMQTCRHPIARVSAIGRFLDCVKLEIELNQSLGTLPRVNASPMIVQQNTEGGSAALMIKGVFWERPVLEPMNVTSKEEKDLEERPEKRIRP